MLLQLYLISPNCFSCAKRAVRNRNSERVVDSTLVIELLESGGDERLLEGAIPILSFWSKSCPVVDATSLRSSSIVEKISSADEVVLLEFDLWGSRRDVVLTEPTSLVD